MPSDLHEFAAELAKSDLREVDLAAALIWFLGHQSGHSVEVSAREVADALIDLRLRSSINLSRLTQNLSKHTELVRGRSVGTYRVKAGKEDRFQERFGNTVEKPKPVIVDNIIPGDLDLGARPLFDALRDQANGAFGIGFYDASAVMCRRLVEILLIEAFDAAGHLGAITDGRGELKPFGEIINVAKSKQYLRLSRSAPGVLDRVKVTGDGGAHGRYYQTRERDIQELNPGLRQLIAELASLARATKG